MKRHFISLILLLLSIFNSVDNIAQVPGVRWSRSLKETIQYPTANVVIMDMKPTSDKGFILTGTLGGNMQFFQIPEKWYASTGSAFIKKTDSLGNTQWDKFILPPSYGSALTSVVQTKDGGYVAAGYIVQDFSDSAQLLLVKYNNTGSLLWEKRYGGTGTDVALCISNTATNGFIVSGFTTSVDGDVTGNHGTGFTTDTWLLRIDDNGAIIWKKCFGGSGEEKGEGVVQAYDYGFVIAGASSSNNGDLTANNGQRDGWLFKTDSSGNLLWQKNYGGIQSEVFRSVIVNPDNSIAVAGDADSTIAITNGNRPFKNAWVMKTTSIGTTIWSKAYGGSGNEGAYSMARTIDDRFLITGYTNSNNFDVSGNNGNNDAWLLSLSTDGDQIWQKCIGTSKNELGIAGTYLSEFDFAIAGTKEGATAQTTDGYLVRLGNSNIIKGTLFFDANSNSIKDAGEILFNNAVVTTQKGSSVQSSYPTNGKFISDIDTGTYQTTLQLFNPYYTVVPASHTTSNTTYLNVDSFGFAVQPIPNKQDLIVHFIPTTPARPGFKSYYVLNYKNIGTTTIPSGTVRLIKDSRINYSISLPFPSSVVADTVTWNYVDLKPLDSVSIALEMQLLTPPTVNINDTLKFKAIILPVAADLSPQNDTSYLKQAVVGSYDPNDKQESFAGRIALKEIADGSYINYMIRFQNTGNDTAFFVRLLDTLDTKLDWNSFQMIGSSHAYNLSIKNGNKLNWFFDNIKLPDSTKNFNKSVGFIAFRIKPKNNLIVNDVIQNKASIYFDYNLPIVTNAVNTIVYNNVVTGVREIQNNEMQFVLSPNPSSGQGYLRVSGKLTGKFHMSVIDNSGKIILSRIVIKNIITEIINVPVDVTHLSAGVYYIKLQQKEKSWWQKLVLQ